MVKKQYDTEEVYKDEEDSTEVRVKEVERKHSCDCGGDLVQEGDAGLRCPSCGKWERRDN